MNSKWKCRVASALLVMTLAISPVAAFAEAADTGTGPARVASAYHKLSGNVQAMLKSAYLEQTAFSQSIGIVVWLRNDGDKVTRVPDAELRVTTDDGVTYTLTPSAANPRSIQPKGKVELSYLLSVNRTDAFSLDKLQWIEVDDYVYPRRETTLLSMDISGKVWRDGDPDASSAQRIGWGQSFRLPAFSDDILFTPTGVQQQVAQGGNVTVVTLRVVNTGKERAIVPDFAISGLDQTKLYAGERTDRKTIQLNPGESKLVRFAITSPASAVIGELVATTPERFVTAGGELSVHHVGHIRMGVPESGFSPAGLGEYEFGTPIALDPLNELVDKDVSISLVELHLHDNQGDGYQTAIAKFKLHNAGKQPAVLPAFQAELTDEYGYTYFGDRQQVVAQRLMPGLSHVVSYAFNVPKSASAGGRYALRLLEGGDTVENPYSSPIAAIGVQMQTDTDPKIWNLYPFQVKLNSWQLNAFADAVPIISYSYKLRLDLDITRTDDVVVDANFSRLKIDIVDYFGKMLGTETIPFVGVNRLISGVQTIRFDQIRTEQLQYPLTIKIYEAIDTPGGEATRLIATLSQR
jgi:hypothetical protein